MSHNDENSYLSKCDAGSSRTVLLPAVVSRKVASHALGLVLGLGLVSGCGDDGNDPIFEDDGGADASVDATSDTTSDTTSDKDSSSVGTTTISNTSMSVTTTSAVTTSTQSEETSTATTDFSDTGTLDTSSTSSSGTPDTTNTGSTDNSSSQSTDSSDSSSEGDAGSDSSTDVTVDLDGGADATDTTDPTDTTDSTADASDETDTTETDTTETDTSDSDTTDTVSDLDASIGTDTTETDPTTDSTDTSDVTVEPDASDAGGPVLLTGIGPTIPDPPVDLALSGAPFADGAPGDGIPDAVFTATINAPISKLVLINVDADGDPYFVDTGGGGYYSYWTSSNPIPAGLFPVAVANTDYNIHTVFEGTTEPFYVPHLGSSNEVALDIYVSFPEPSARAPYYRLYVYGLDNELTQVVDFDPPGDAN